MNRPDFLKVLDEFFELQPGTLTGKEILRDLPGWDSLKLVELIALVDEQFNISLSTELLTKNTSLDEVVALLGDGVKP